jgi:hypothetical protein
MQLKNFICHPLLVVYLMEMAKKSIVVKISKIIKNIMFQAEIILKIHTNQFKVYIYLINKSIKKTTSLIIVQTEYSLNSTWTMKGLQTSAVKPKSFETKPVISKRLEYVLLPDRIDLDISIIANKLKQV